MAQQRSAVQLELICTPPIPNAYPDTGSLECGRERLAIVRKGLQDLRRPVGETDHAGTISLLKRAWP